MKTTVAIALASCSISLSLLEWRSRGRAIGSNLIMSDARLCPKVNTRTAEVRREQVVIWKVGSAWALTEESKMPVLLLWAVPTVIFVGGVGYLLVRAVH